MDTLEICISFIISSFAKCFETSLHQCTNTTAKNCLLTKQICLCLCTECGLKNTGSCSTDCQRICQCDILSFSCSILLNSHKTRNTFSCLILAAYSMSRSLRSHHRNVYIFWWYDLSKVNVETMSEHQHVSSFQVWRDRLFVQFSLQLIVDQDHDDICLFCSLCCCIYFKSLCFCFCPGFRALIQTDNYITSTFFCIQCMCMSLAAISDNSNCLTIQKSKVTVTFIENLCVCHCFHPPKIINYYIKLCQINLTDVLHHHQCFLPYSSVRHPLVSPVIPVRTSSLIS